MEEPRAVTAHDIVQIFVSDPLWKLVYPSFHTRCEMILRTHNGVALVQAAVSIAEVYNKLWIVRDAKYDWSRTVIGVEAGGADYA